MFNLNEFITFSSESAYESAYDLAVKKKYSTPKIYIAGGDLKKRWYVYFSYQDPKTEKMKRVRIKQYFRGAVIIKQII